MEQFVQKRYFRFKTTKVNTTIEFYIFELVWVPTFTLSKQYLIFCTKFTRKIYFWSKKKKNEHYRWVLNLWISLGTKFQPKLTIFAFWTKCAQKRYLRSKKRKIAISSASMVITYHSKLFRSGANRHNRIFMSLLLLVSKTIMITISCCAQQRLFLKRKIKVSV